MWHMYVKYLESEAKKVHILTSNLKLIQIKFLSKKEEKFCLNKSQFFLLPKSQFFTKKKVTVSELLNVYGWVYKVHKCLGFSLP